MEMYLKTIGFHILPTEEQLFDILGRKIRKEGGGGGMINMASHADDHDFPFPIIDRDLYSGEPWELFTNEDPWEVDDSGVKRTLYVFTTLKATAKSSKRFARVTGSGTWYGSTGEKLIRDGGSNQGLVIGSRSYLHYKPKQESPVAGTIREGYGHWMMHEYKLAGDSLKGLETTLLALAKVRVLCKISQVVEKGSIAHSFWPKEPLDRCWEEYISQGLFETRIMTSCNEDSDHQLPAATATNKRECPEQQENLPMIKKRRIMQNQEEEEEEKGYSTKSSTLTERETCNLFDSIEDLEFAAFIENTLMMTEPAAENCNLFDWKEKEDQEVSAFLENSLMIDTEYSGNLFDSKKKEEEGEEFVGIEDDSLTRTETACNLEVESKEKEEEEEVAVMVDNSVLTKKIDQTWNSNIFGSKEEEEGFGAFVDDSIMAEILHAAGDQLQRAF